MLHTRRHMLKPFSQSPYNGANIDIGHYTAGRSGSPIPFIEKHHARITSMHLKYQRGEPMGEAHLPPRVGTDAVTRPCGSAISVAGMSRRNT